MTITPDSHLVPVSKVADKNALAVNDDNRDSMDISADVGAVANALHAADDMKGVGAVADALHAADDMKGMLRTPGMANAALRMLPDVLDEETCAELMTSLLSHSNEAVRMAVQSALQRASGNQSVIAHETCANLDTPASPVVEPDLGLTSAPANSCSFDRLSFMLNQVPIDAPTQRPTEAAEAIAEDEKDALSVSTNNDMNSDVDEEESEDVGMEGPEQVTSSTGCTPDATGTRTDAVEDWLLL